jgi:hypothetical protein
MAVLVSLGLAWGSVAAAASTASARTSLPRQPFPKVEQPGVTDTEIRVGGVVSKTNPLGVDTPRRSGLLPGIDWTTAHSQNPA